MVTPNRTHDQFKEVQVNGFAISVQADFVKDTFKM